MQALFPYDLCGYTFGVDLKADRAVGMDSRVALQVIHMVLELLLALGLRGQWICVNEIALLINEANEEDGEKVSHGVPTLGWLLKQPNLASRLVCVGSTPRQESSLYAVVKMLAVLNFFEHVGNAVHGN